MTPSDWSGPEWLIVVVALAAISTILLFFASQTWAIIAVAFVFLLLLIGLLLVPVVAGLHWFGALTAKGKCPRCTRSQEAV